MSIDSPAHSPQGYDIRFGAPGPAGFLSNLSPFPFIFDGIRYGSMEGFLQSLKFQHEVDVVGLREMSGLNAQRTGQAGNRWKESQTLWYRGMALKRQGVVYPLILRLAFEALYRQNPGYRAAIKATVGAALYHSIGKADPTDTILTETEFIDLLEWLQQYPQDPSLG